MGSRAKGQGIYYSNNEGFGGVSPGYQRSDRGTWSSPFLKGKQQTMILDKGRQRTVIKIMTDIIMG